MYAAVKDSECETVLECQRRINALARIIPACNGKVIPAIKSAAAMQGRGNHRMHIAAHDLSSHEIDALRDVAHDLKLPV
jgi:dihydrodipicolinate synthase/N-acetylneuraminate lyase